ncbi:hypothetical protein K488DRAFT_83465 [Vararia minispora EC-137]|uniref:Uncharacterized protein n=1 Tax=Vararia minispora EC-137 TaxID=1314806 RepID=A0ACB8QSY5_9AGAM|nr:hypothetical protein K488DRAFT_83465 [Vararia minispora EC-137]
MASICDQDFSDGDADLVLRSSSVDPSHVQIDFRVHRIVISKASQLLKDVLSNSNSTAFLPRAVHDAQPQWTKLDDVDVLVLADTSDTIRLLLKAIYPVPFPCIDSLEEAARLTSSARAYGLGSAAERFSDQFKRLTTSETAFRSYIIARRQGLNHEAEYAAQKSLLVDMSIDNCIDDLLHATGQDLKDLYDYRKTCFSNARQALQAIDYAQLEKTCQWAAEEGSFPHMCNKRKSPRYSPTWFFEYVQSLINSSSLAVEFEVLRTLMRKHAIKDSCDFCSTFPFRSLQRASTHIRDRIDQSVSKVALRVLPGYEPPPAPKKFGLPFDTIKSDMIVLRSRDQLDFFVLRDVLAMASPIFDDMFRLPQNDNVDIHPDDFVDGKPCVRMTEDAATLNCLLTLILPLPFSLPMTYAEAAPLYAALQKFQITSRESVLRTLLQAERRALITQANAFGAFAAAHRHRLRDDALKAAYATLPLTFTFESIADVLESFSGAAIPDSKRRVNRFSLWNGAVVDKPLLHVHYRLARFYLCTFDSFVHRRHQQAIEDASRAC